jgi:multimeric flavodoxin WrbA
LIQISPYCIKRDLERPGNLLQAHTKVQFQNDNQFPVDFKGYVIEQVPVEHPFQGIDGNGYVRRQLDTSNSPIKFPQGIRVAEGEKPELYRAGTPDYHSRGEEEAMKVIGINGSPRKGWNTHILAEEALRGAASRGAETELVHLYDLSFKGCASCFECKRKGGPSLGRCAVRDALGPVLDRVDACDALFLASPIYIGELSASTRALIERLTFQYISYEKDRKPLFTRRIPVGLIYTMNIPETALDQAGYRAKFTAYEALFTRIFGSARTLLSTETWQTEDYGLYGITMVSEAERRKRREEVFPRDRAKAFEMGAEFAARREP